MSVLFDSSASKYGTVSSGGGSVSVTHTVNALATNLVAVVGALWLGTANASGGSITATFGGTSMTAATPLRWDSNKAAFAAFTLGSPSTGSQTASVSVSTMGSAGKLIIVSGTYSGVDQIGDLVSAVTDGSTATTSNGITVSSVLPAYRVVAFHAVGTSGVGTRHFTSYSQSKRASGEAYVWPYTYGEVLLGDAPGAASVTLTATQSSSANWGVFGIPLSPALVTGDASLNVSVGTTASGHLYRSATPSPLRTWLIES